MRCSGLSPRRPRGWFGLLRVLSCGKHVRCGCCRVTSQKSFPIVCRQFSSLFFDVMPSILRLRLDGWFSRCRGQSSGKSASRQRAKKYQQSYERCSRDVQESHEMFKPRERFATRALFSTVRLAPAHGRLVESDCPYGAEPRPCPGLLGWNLSSVISLHFWEGINLSIFIHV